MKAKVGDKFSRLTVIDCWYEIKSNNIHRSLKCKCICECGREKDVWATYLINNETKSCGCLQTESRGKSSRTHNLSHHSLYSVYANMKTRCYWAKSENYHNYGGRGIIICDEWLADFQKFYEWAMKSGWEKGLTVDRINNDGNYEPSNCRCTTPRVQGNNTRTNLIIKAFGEEKTLADWVRDDRCLVSYSILQHRIKKKLLSSNELAISTPLSYTRIKQKNSKYKYKGVSQSKNGRWISYLFINKQRIHLTTSDSEIEAAEIYDLALLKYKNEQIFLNFPEKLDYYKSKLEEGFFSEKKHEQIIKAINKN
jgi:hypothetical protein